MRVFNNRFTRPFFGPIIRLLVRTTPTRVALNYLHNRLSYAQREAFFWAFASAFRGTEDSGFKPRLWKVRFGDEHVLMPLSPPGLWEKWGLAIGATGHDHVVKETYEYILRASSFRPSVFVDLGANSGVHSLLIAKRGVHVIAFEPNPLCAPTAIELFAINRVDVEWNSFAVGSETRESVLTFPVGDTSLGVVSDRVIEGDGLKNFTVRQVRLDDQTIPPGKVLIKIDVEGNELAVLKGASTLLRERSPLIVFESNRCDPNRSAIYSFLTAQQYRIELLPWSPCYKPSRLRMEAFLGSESNNFIAIPERKDTHL